MSDVFSFTLHCFSELMYRPIKCTHEWTRKEYSQKQTLESEKS